LQIISFAVCVIESAEGSKQNINIQAGHVGQRHRVEIKIKRIDGEERDG